jgi:signal transduction histidine kinase
MDGITGAVFGLAVLAIPVGAGIGILRHRLYDIDLIISKTLVYGGLVVFVTASYVLVVVGVGALIGAHANLGLSVVATTIAALAFQPVRTRLTELVNRMVWGEPAGPLELLTRLVEGMASGYEIDQVVSTTARLVTEGVGASRGAVWLRQGSVLVPGAVWPAIDSRLPQPFLVVGETLPTIEEYDRWYPVWHRGALIGALSITMPAGRELTGPEEQQLSQLAWTAGLVLENVRLVDELRASRLRIVAAQDSERRRIERDLHDGAQQRLVNVSLAIGVARADLGHQVAPTVLAALDRAAAEAQEALTELRELARGIHPAILTDRGLAPAVRSLFERSPVPAILAAAPDERLPPAAEATAYFVVAESLANAVKHATPTRIEAGIARHGAELLVRVCDNGQGGAVFRAGGGLQGLADRVAVLGGRIQLESTPHVGTRVTAVMPCA